MTNNDAHILDEQLVLSIDGELSAQEERSVRGHLDTCWKCRARRQELENAISEYVRHYQRESEGQLPSPTGPRALLKAQLGEAARSSAKHRAGWFSFDRALPLVLTAAAICLVIAGVPIVRRISSSLHPHFAVVSIPNSALTPGATVLLSRSGVCSQVNVKNKAVPNWMQSAVFKEYGIAGAEASDYEVDYLVTPALGGADDIHNLWPHSYSSTVWNAKVKDALEDRLRDMVCDGRLDLAEAQKEIATDWIGAYKHYFQTAEPLPEHSRTPTP